MKVSVVVPVYNPWPWIQACVDSLTKQTLSREEFEVIFVDDGSTDETPGYLDACAERYSHFSVIHQENSGWPGKPRNVGIEASRGEYIFFCDNDDWLGDEALERMYDYAHAHDADVLLAKMAGIGRPVPQHIFRMSRASATLADAPLMDSLTPHKLFRKAFLQEHQIRFPEGKRRLEDHYFVVSSYLMAQKISVYADYTCYYHIRREDSSNAGFSSIDWDSYFFNLSEAVDVVVAHTEPGDLRDRICRRWLQNEMVNRLSGRRFTSLDPEEAHRLFQAAHRTAARYFGEGVVARLPVLSRGVARNLIAGDFDAVRRLAEAEDTWELKTRLLQACWVGGRLQVSGVAAFQDTSIGPGAGLRESRLLSDLTEDEVTAGLTKSSLVLDLTERRDGERWTVRSVVTHFGHVMAFEAELEPSTLAVGQPLRDGIWDLFVEGTLLGLRRRRRLTLRHDRLPTPLLAPAGAEGSSRVAAYLTKNHDGLSLDVGLLYHEDLRSDSFPKDDAAGAAPPARDTSPVPADPSAAPGWRSRANPLKRRLARKLGGSLRPSDTDQER